MLTQRAGSAAPIRVAKEAGPGLVLLHSPLVGPSCWQSLAERLRAAGHQVIAPDLRAAATSDDHQQSFIADVVTAIRAAPMRPAVLVGHSGAGPLLPAIAAATPTVGVIFVDAELPHPGASWLDTAAPALVAHLLSLTDENGVLPRWSDWFDPGVLTEAIPDAELRVRFVAELPRLSLRYFERPAPPAVWPGPAGYLQLSPGYGAAAERAAAAGYPVQRLMADHLAILTAPERVHPALTLLLDAITTPPPPNHRQ